MNKLLPFFSFFTAIVISVFLFPEGASATLICLFAAAITIVIINHFTADDAETRTFLLQIFVLGVLFRVFIAVITHIFNLQVFFCQDAIAFEEAGAYLSASWSGYELSTLYSVERFTDTSASGWGISYLTALIYMVTGRNPLAVQMFISVLGAATAVLVYFCTKQIFKNSRVARFSAILVMFFPSMALWSSQILKDGVVIFLIVATICIVLKLRQQFSYLYLILLLACLFGIAAFRIYILLALAPAIVGSFIIDPQKSSSQLVFRTAAIVVIAVTLAYFGFLGSIENRLGDFTLENMSRHRQYLSTVESGFGQELDVSTPMGALRALPIGFAYLMLAPFPWAMENFRQAITLPEVLLWWSLIPFLISGLWYTMKRRFGNSILLLLFLFILTLTYSVSQGNVGTAYRQRAQIQVLYFIFISVGIAKVIERRENIRLLKDENNRKFRLLNKRIS